MSDENRFLKTAITLLVCLVIFFICTATAFAESDVRDTAPAGEWKKDDIGWWFRNADGTYPAAQWSAIAGKWYYFDEIGYMVQGWQHIGGNWYYFDEAGYMMQGWQYIDDIWYYLGWPEDPDSGAMATGLREIDGRWYYFNPSGAMQRGHQSVDGLWYYFGFSEYPDTGARRTGWIYDKETGGKYYALEDGTLVTGLFLADAEELKAFIAETAEAEETETFEGVEAAESDEPSEKADATQGATDAPQEVASATTETPQEAPETIKIYFDEEGTFAQSIEFEIDGEFYGADEGGNLFKYSNSDLSSGKIQAHSYGSRDGRPVSKITIHHMAAVMTAENCGHYFETTSDYVSSTYGIGYDGDIYQYVDEKDWSHCSSDPDNDKVAITIEVSNLRKGDDWPITDEAMASLLDLCTDICERNGIEYLDFTGDPSGNITMHKWFNPTNCPGPYLESRFPTIAEEVNLRLAVDEIDTLGWVQIAGKWYYFDESGAVRNRWIQDDGNWYYLKESGAMASEEFINGWWLNKNGSWTYPYQSRWYQTDNGRWWYGDESGWFASGERYRIDGVDYRFNYYGLWVGWEY